ncbi:hypothetical protein PGTUg99_024491 [Puccinia graminis f. sp. tritici]|uniref:Uncharacterized protein n=1 Tax=Puccinia graminis f. sp. tritici TaxID=56615 RepID=A0A5B0MD84_PUCGR|nr:hypothetical protein PGTUg99_024491 [Puccinia graminis f. sp. tritici]
MNEPRTWSYPYSEARFASPASIVNLNSLAHYAGLKEQTFISAVACLRTPLARNWAQSSYQATHACHPRSFKPLKGRQQIHITLSRKPPFITATEDNSALSPSYLSAKSFAQSSDLFY